MNTKNQKNAVFISGVTLATLALSGCGNTTSPIVTPTPQPLNTEVPTPTSTSSTSSRGYKDGTYSAVGIYKSPAGPEEIGVTLTLKNNLITDISVEPKATVRRSVEMQQAFASGYKSLVVGKNIADVHLQKVSGASLTPMGFNDALAKIELQAL